MKVFILMTLLGFSTKALCLDRIIAIGGTVTEIVFALGEGKKVVGVDGTSIYPQEVEKIKKIGMGHDVSIEGILSLRPDLILISSTFANPLRVEQLKKTNLRFEVIEEKPSFENAKEKINQVALLLGVSKKGKTLSEKIDQDLKLAEELKAKLPKKRMLFIYARGPNQVFIAGIDTPAHAMIDSAGGLNAGDKVSGFKPLTNESLALSNPDAIIMLNSGFSGLPKGPWEMKGMSQTNAGKNKKMILVDDLAFLGFGPRSGNALNDLVKEISKI